jgi:signal transduction histidine kinase/CheY-like chemotaxis protein
VSSHLIPQLLVGPLLGAFWSLQRVHPAPFARHWFWAWVSIYVAAALTGLGAQEPVFRALGLVPGSLHPFLLLTAALHLSGRVAPRPLLLAAGALGALRALGLELGYETLVFACWIPCAIVAECVAALCMRGSDRPGPLAGRGRLLAPITLGYAVIHGVWLGASVIDPVLADRFAPTWVVAAAILGSVQMLSLVDLSRLYEGHLRRERGLAQQALERRYEFERRLVELSTRFVRLAPDEVDAAVEAALGEVGEFAGADRAGIVLFRREDGRGDNTHEWCRSGTPSVRARLQDLPIEVFDRSPGGESVITHLSEITDPGDRAYLEELGLLSVLSAPLRAGSEIIGRLGLSALHAERHWSDGEVALLRLCADLFANALGRKRWTLALAERESELRQAQKMEAVGRLAGGVAHDFNNLLTVITGYGEQLAEKLEDDTLQECAREVVVAAERAAELTRRLLAFGRRQVLDARPFDLNHTVEGLQTMLARLIGEHVRLETRLAPSMAPVQADRAQIEQVIVNLVVNARDAMPDGGVVTITTEGTTIEPGSGSLAPGSYARLVVDDTGEGIAPALRSKIFEPFFTTKAPGIGTGLGLAMVQGVIEQSGGAVELDSEPGRGTHVALLLPFAQEAIAPPTPRSEVGESSELRGAPVTLLLVEDEERVRRLSRRTLERAGYEVLEAGDGQEALEVAGRHPGTIDLLFTDVVMPRLGGRALAEQLRHAREGLRVLFTSGYPTHPYDPASGLPSGCNFLAKPFTTAALREALRD